MNTWWSHIFRSLSAVVPTRAALMRRLSVCLVKQSRNKYKRMNKLLLVCNQCSRCVKALLRNPPRPPRGSVCTWSASSLFIIFVIIQEIKQQRSDHCRLHVAPSSLQVFFSRSFTHATKLWASSWWSHLVTVRGQCSALLRSQALEDALPPLGGLDSFL